MDEKTFAQSPLLGMLIPGPAGKAEAGDKLNRTPHTNSGFEPSTKEYTDMIKT